MSSVDTLTLGDRIKFVYTKGEHAYKPRQMTIDTIYPDGDVGGYEEIVADKEYRRFKKDGIEKLVVVYEDQHITFKVEKSKVKPLIELLENILDQIS